MNLFGQMLRSQPVAVGDQRPDPGIFPYAVIVRATNRSGSAYAAGDIVQFDFAQTAGETTTVTLGATTSIWVNTVDPTAAGVLGGAFLGIAMEAIDNDSSGDVMIQGIFDAFVIRATGNIAIGDRLVATTAKNLDGVAATGEIYYAYALEAQSAPTTRTASSVLFNGVPGGFGQAT